MTQGLYKEERYVIGLQATGDDEKLRGGHEESLIRYGQCMCSIHTTASTQDVIKAYVNCFLLREIVEDIGGTYRWQLPRTQEESEKEEMDTREKMADRLNMNLELRAYDLTCRMFPELYRRLGESGWDVTHCTQLDSSGWRSDWPLKLD
tara:strand:- start:1493 stop:1939 length:447 start_codon:yes stop_codon:yes gene_type:complete